MSIQKPHTKAQSKKINPQRPHYFADIAGICCIALALILIVALRYGDAGVIGESILYFFQILFGHGIWVTPILIGVLGVLLILNKQNFHLKRIFFGLLLIFLATVGGFAKHAAGDYFDPDIAAQSGGYAGALISWIFDFLFGSAKAVGLITLGLIGGMICLNEPLRYFFRNLIQKTRRGVPVTQKQGQQMATYPLEAAEDTSFSSPASVIAAPPIFREINTDFSFKEAAESIPKEGYNLPPLALLHEPAPVVKRSPQEMQQNIKTLLGTLEQFRIEANVVEVATGPTITRYEIQLGPGIKVSRITALADNIAMNLAASHVRVEAPIPGKSAIGVEVPNSNPSTVMLRQLCENKEFMENPSRLLVALGQDVSGVNKYADLTKMPHLLIGGATNSGKSIGLATIITSLLIRNTPKDVKMVMIDPKRVELSLFDGIPHLMCPVVKDVKEAPGVLRAVWREMDKRYDIFSEAGVRNIDGWNEKASFQEKMSYIVVIIDELADLMIQAAAEVETSICRLAQLARATGIHLVIATQRPSVDVITGTIKANIASRMAFAVSSQIDSRTILDQAGAERLIGRGDMLFAPIGSSKPTRVQGCYVSEKEIEEISGHWKAQEQPHYVLDPIDIAIQEREADLNEQESDPLWEDAIRWVAERGQASTSMLQRRFSIGFQRASRLLDLMEERRIVGPRDGPRPREVLINPLEVENMFSR